jgi:hypothetical protein
VANSPFRFFSLFYAILIRRKGFFMSEGQTIGTPQPFQKVERINIPNKPEGTAKKCAQASGRTI